MVGRIQQGTELSWIRNCSSRKRWFRAKLECWAIHTYNSTAARKYQLDSFDYWHFRRGKPAQWNCSRIPGRTGEKSSRTFFTGRIIFCDPEFFPACHQQHRTFAPGKCGWNSAAGVFLSCKTAHSGPLGSLRSATMGSNTKAWRSSDLPVKKMSVRRMSAEANWLGHYWSIMQSKIKRIANIIR